MDQLQLEIGIAELSELEPSASQDGYEEVRREINYLLATLKALVVLLPRSVQFVNPGSTLPN